ncbi:DUF6308 family protein [Arthrobacter sp. NPDC055138]
MKQKTAQTLIVAGQSRSVQDSLGILERYPRKTPAAFDLIGPGQVGELTGEEVVRTRKISSRISNREVAFFIKTAATAPWIDAADLADASPGTGLTDGQLFTSMSDLYWHFAEGAPKGVSFAKISKVLHLKMPSLFPILDRHIARSYTPAAKALKVDYPQLGWRRRTWLAIRNDLLDARASGGLDELRAAIRSYESTDARQQDHVRRFDGLTDLRLLDILVW